MSGYDANPYAAPDVFDKPAAYAQEAERIGFIRRTYGHLAGAVALFVILEAIIFTVFAEALEPAMEVLASSRYGWLAVLGAFMGVGWLADWWARSETSRAMQYAGLGLYVLAEALIFVPLLWIASRFAPDAIPAAGLMTLIVFGCLTAVVFFTGADLASWRKYLWFGGILALGLIVVAIVFGFSLGIWFSGAMIGLASAYVLYYTSNVLHHYRVDQHVAAALALFAAVALLFWYILRFVMAFSGRD